MTLGFSKIAKTGLTVIGLAYLIALWFAIEFLSDLYINNALAASRENTQQRVSSISSQLEVALYEDIFISDSLATLVGIDPEFAKTNWSEIASNLVSKASYVINIAISPNDVVFNTYPLAGNEAILGLDYRDVPDQYATILKAKLLKDIYLAGPVELVQGGTGLVARFPVFADFPENTDYWGSVGVVFDYEKLIDSLELPSIQGANIAIRRMADNSTSSGRVFYGSASVFDNPDSVIDVTLPGANWQLATQFSLEDSSAIDRIRTIIRVFGWGLGLIVLASTVLIFRYIQFTRIASLQDELTQLPNRRFAMHQLKQQMQKSQDLRSFAVLNIDVNDFKAVNDSFGHDVGDAFLKHIAHTLKGAVRAADPVSRLGGDEFLVILHRIENKDQVLHTRDKIQRLVQQNTFFTHQQTITPSVSIGLAMAREYPTLTLLLKAADRDMYQQKQEGKKPHLVLRPVSLDDTE